jgi:hypothetical protein
MADPLDTGTNPTSATGAVADPNIGQQTGTESSLSNWVGPYVTEMLGRGQGLAGEDYQAYTGPLTAGESTAQSAAFQGVAGLAIPTEQMGAFTPQQFTAEQAQAYMNPYLTAALQPQIDEARRQAQIQRLADAGRLTKAGAFGGSRQAIMESEGNRNLLQNLAGITGTGYATAYDKAAQLFGQEQDRGLAAQTAANVYGLEALTKQANLGAEQRAIEQEGITADRLQFEEERDFPYKQVQYMQSLLQGLPLAAQSYTYSQPSIFDQITSGGGDILAVIEALFGSGGGGTATNPDGSTPTNEFTGPNDEDLAMGAPE